MPTETYEPIITADGSPSLKWRPTNEAMHNLQGAWSETCEIYLRAMDQVLSQTGELKVLSVGLGLGYNELLFAGLSCKYPHSSFYLESFEKDELLRKNFLLWLTGQPQQWPELYMQIVQLVAEHFQISSQKIRTQILNLIQTNKMILRQKLSSTTQFSRLMNCILYDPFSSNTNPELWQELEVISILKNCADTPCLLSTYAAKGALTRSLKELQFNVEKCVGFGGKRQRTWATRPFAAAVDHSQV